jgi:hypothetical protein
MAGTSSRWRALGVVGVALLAMVAAGACSDDDEPAGDATTATDQADEAGSTAPGSAGSTGAASDQPPATSGSSDPSTAGTGDATTPTSPDPSGPLDDEVVDGTTTVTTLSPEAQAGDPLALLVDGCANGDLSSCYELGRRGDPLPAGLGPDDGYGSDSDADVLDACFRDEVAAACYEAGARELAPPEGA